MYKEDKDKISEEVKKRIKELREKMEKLDINLI